MVDRINKRGDYKYGIILSLILGMMVLSLSLYFIFQELWSQDELDWEICRQSIQIRALLPDVEKWGITVNSFKNDYPLKCKTMVVNIEKSDVKDIEDAQKIIADTIARCWALYDKGDSNAFPAKFYKSTTCVPCARIHLTEDAKKYMKENEEKYKNKKGIIGINIRTSLDLPMDDDYSYYKYLNNSGKKFAAFNFGNGLPFDLEGGGFEIENASGLWEDIDLRNKLNGGTFTAAMRSSNIMLPMFFDVTKGDLLINYGIVTISDEDFGDYIPYLFYFQAGQGYPFEEVKEDFIFNFLRVPSAMLEILYDIPTEGWDAFRNKDVGFCEQWEGIPA